MMLQLDDEINEVGQLGRHCSCCSLENGLHFVTNVIC